MLIDIYTHIFPARFFDYLLNGSNKLGSLAERLKYPTSAPVRQI